MRVFTVAIATTIAVAVAITGCSAATPEASTARPSDNPSPATATPTAPAPASDFAVVSDDFEDGGELGAWASAQAFGGTCDGDNLNPHLAWSGAPADTEAYAITMADVSIGLFVHWVHVNIPADVTEVERGASESLAGLPGRHGNAGNGYFGPCPDADPHEYVITLWALDEPLDFDEGQAFSTFMSAADGHVLASTTITGFYGPPADN